MKSREVHFWLAVTAFPFTYSVIFLFYCWVDIYLLNHWDPKWDQAGAMWFAVLGSPLVSSPPFTGYAIVLLGKWNYVVQIRPINLAIVATLTALLSFSSFPVVKHFPVPEITIFLLPAAWTLLVLWVDQKLKTNPSTIHKLL